MRDSREPRPVATPVPGGDDGRARDVRAVVDVQNLTFSYKRTPVLLRVSFSVYPGDFVAMIGPNGSGKSTLCRVLRGIVPTPSGARVEVGGAPAGSAPALRMTCYTADNDHVPRFLSAQEYVRFLARLHSAPGRRIRFDPDAVDNLFATLGMGGRTRDLMTGYSHGMVKKTQLAAALLVSRPVTVVDETMNGIDIEAQYRIEGVLREYCAAGGAVIMCSHDFSMLQRCANRVIMLDEGYVVEDAYTQSLSRQSTSIEDLVTGYLGVGGG
ncbi:ATP-binding cassette domain-containing protein [Actinomyces wuliandei]|uniref:ATP-binding cassette domain-containing protein n=1 Tax=Actinomyces wuliandei TaxID=2057743 RepID=UPI0019D4A884|nr:ABC transporter ATP-binding protein [Actinomyces wuliandei]